MPLSLTFILTVVADCPTVSMRVTPLVFYIRTEIIQLSQYGSAKKARPDHHYHIKAMDAEKIPAQW